MTARRTQNSLSSPRERANQTKNEGFNFAIWRSILLSRLNRKEKKIIAAELRNVWKSSAMCLLVKIHEINILLSVEIWVQFYGLHVLALHSLLDRLKVLLLFLKPKYNFFLLLVRQQWYSKKRTKILVLFVTRIRSSAFLQMEQ